MSKEPVVTYRNPFDPVGEAKATQINDAATRLVDHQAMTDLSQPDERPAVPTVSAAGTSPAVIDRRAEIAERHSRAEDSNKGAADWLADYAEDAHNDRGWLLSELTRLTADLERMREAVRTDKGEGK